MINARHRDANLCMIGPACIGLATSPSIAIALSCVGGFTHQMLAGALITLCSDLPQSAVRGARHARPHRSSGTLVAARSTYLQGAKACLIAGLSSQLLQRPPP